MNNFIEQLINIAILEDIGDGDHTSLSCISPNEKGKVKLLIKEKGVLAGVNIAQKVAQIINPELKFQILINDGQSVKPGDIAFFLQGNQISILQAERIILNFMQRMSGIASQTAIYAEKIKDLKTKILDTRKTTPGLRLIEKYAVEAGGGKNHRMGLYDMVMIKDNHVDFAGGIQQAITKTLEYLNKNKKNIKIEIEVRNFDELQQVLKTGKIHRIMLDNFSVEDTKKAVEIINGKYETESSGGITLETIRDYALCGVDYISVGALTHQIKSLDMSLKAVD